MPTVYSHICPTCRIIERVVSDSNLLPAGRRGRLATPGALTTANIAAIDDDGSWAQRRSAETLMHAFGLRRSDCTLTLCWVVRFNLWLPANPLLVCTCLC